jgi:hypothetical protein
MEVFSADRSRLTIETDTGPLIIGAVVSRSLRIERRIGRAVESGGSGWSVAEPLHHPLDAEWRLEGLLTASAGEQALTAAHLAGATRQFTLEIAGGGRWEGPFVIRSLTLTGRAEEEMRFSAVLSSAGPVTFTEDGAAL